MLFSTITNPKIELRYYNGTDGSGYSPDLPLEAFILPYPKLQFRVGDIFIFHVNGSIENIEKNRLGHYLKVSLKEHLGNISSSKELASFEESIIKTDDWVRKEQLNFHLSKDYILKEYHFREENEHRPVLFECEDEIREWLFVDIFKDWICLKLNSWLNSWRNWAIEQNWYKQEWLRVKAGLEESSLAQRLYFELSKLGNENQQHTWCEELHRGLKERGYINCTLPDFKSLWGLTQTNPVINWSKDKNKLYYFCKKIPRSCSGNNKAEIVETRIRFQKESIDYKKLKGNNDHPADHDFTNFVDKVFLPLA